MKNGNVKSAIKMTFILKYRELRRLFSGYYDYLVAADKELTAMEKTKLVNELSRVALMIEDIEEMSFQEVRRSCYHSHLRAPSRLNRDRPCER